jgi:hypothetical protein
MHRHFIQNSWHVRSPNRRTATLMWNVQRVKYHPKNQTRSLPVRHRNKQLTRQKRVRTSRARTLRQRNVTHNSPKLKLSDLSAGGAKLNAALERLEMEKNRSRSQSSHDGVRRIWRGRHFDPPSCNCLICPFRKSEEGNSSQEGALNPRRSRQKSFETPQLLRRRV